MRLRDVRVPEAVEVPAHRPSDQRLAHQLGRRGRCLAARGKGIGMPRLCLGRRALEREAGDVGRVVHEPLGEVRAGLGVVEEVDGVQPVHPAPRDAPPVERQEVRGRQVGSDGGDEGVGSPGDAEDVRRAREEGRCAGSPRRHRRVGRPCCRQDIPDGGSIHPPPHEAMVVHGQLPAAVVAVATAPRPERPREPLREHAVPPGLERPHLGPPHVLGVGECLCLCLCLCLACRAGRLGGGGKGRRRLLRGRARGVLGARLDGALDRRPASVDVLRGLLEAAGHAEAGGVLPSV